MPKARRAAFSVLIPRHSLPWSAQTCPRFAWGDLSPRSKAVSCHRTPSLCLPFILLFQILIDRGEPGQGFIPAGLQ